jgi:methionyl-tRNA formyltransferase
VANLVRGVTPEPGAFTTIEGARLKVLEAAITRDVPRLAPGELALDGRRLLAGTASDPIELLVVQPAGKKPMSAVDWWRGRPANATRVAE